MNEWLAFSGWFIALFLYIMDIRNNDNFFSLQENATSINCNFEPFSVFYRLLGNFKLTFLQ